MRNVSLKIPSTVKEIGKRAFYRRVTPAYGEYLSLIVEPGSYAYDYAKKNALSMDLGETTILYTTCMNGDHIWQQQDRESYWKTQWNLRSDRRQGNRQNHHYYHYEERQELSAETGSHTFKQH